MGNEIATCSPADEPERDILRFAETEWASRVEWAKDQIASECYVPLLPPKIWAGRDDIITGCAEQFRINLSDAAKAVDAAAMDLCLLERDDPSPALKRTMLMRLVGIRKILAQAMKDGRSEMQYKWEPDPDGGEPKKVPFKEKKFVGVDMAAIGRLLEVERNIAELQGLKGPEDATASLSIIDELDAALDGKTKRKVVVSLAQKLKTGEIGSLSPDGRRMLDAAVKEMNKSNPVEGEVVDDDPEEESESQ